MDIKLLTVTDLQNHFQAFAAQVEALIHSTKHKPVYTDEEFRELMGGICAKTSLTWRNQGKIGFSQVGRIIIYRWEDIQQFLQQNHKKPF